MANGICGHAGIELNNKIIQLANEGLSIKQIADGVGMKKPAVASRMTTLMRDGKLKAHSERTGRINTARGRYHILKDRHNRNNGSIMDLLMQLTFNQTDWIYKTAPEGLTIAEWIAVLLRDVIAEEEEA